MISSHVACMSCIQLFRERSLEKKHVTITKAILGDFEFTVFKKTFETKAREAMDVCLRVLKESNKIRFDSYSVRNSVLIISHTTFRDCRVYICCPRSLTDNLPRNSCIYLSLAVSKEQGLKSVKHHALVISASM